ncbi:MAG TPA: NUDIX domain-containing protein [Candidatus Gracilibacteria bacterium]|nr:NUDIX domain-containing protein [Candidatus Gracilibacteria bacterium]
MKELPLSVAVCALVNDNKILLIKRVRGDYVGLYALPGGKIEKHEHFADAAMREIEEETGIKTEFKDYLGLVSEHLVENGDIIQHFLLHFCELIPMSKQTTNSGEGDSTWFDLKQITLQQNQIVPSDYLMIEKLLLNKGKKHYHCSIEKNGESHTLKYFKGGKHFNQNSPESGSFHRLSFG